MSAAAKYELRFTETKVIYSGLLSAERSCR
jgi:hypothetical protein